MRISAKIDYACRALMELSMHWPNKDPMPIGEIARKQDVSIQFLTQILITLKQLGYTESIRGKKGGYLLAKAPRQIKLDELITDLGSVGYCTADHQVKGDGKHIMDQIWDEIDQVVLNAMHQINFEDISNRKRSKENIVTFEI